MWHYMCANTDHWYHCNVVMAILISKLNLEMHIDLYITFYRKFPNGEHRHC